MTCLSPSLSLSVPRTFSLSLSLPLSSSLSLSLPLASSLALNLPLSPGARSKSGTRCPLSSTPRTRCAWYTSLYISLSRSLSLSLSLSLSFSRSLSLSLARAHTRVLPSKREREREGGGRNRVAERVSARRRGQDAPGTPTACLILDTCLMIHLHVLS